MLSKDFFDFFEDFFERFESIGKSIFYKFFFHKKSSTLVLLLKYMI